MAPNLREKILILTISDVIKELSPLPAGVLYAAIQGRMSLQELQAILGLLVTAKVIEYSDNHMITWRGVAEVVDEPEVPGFEGLTKN